MDALSSAVTVYIAAFTGYVGQFLEWGKWIFYSLLTINIVWMSLWYAFDKNSFVESMPDFLKRFFMIALFYTIMINNGWMFDLLATATFMGEKLTHMPIDPSSIISNGIEIANKLLVPAQKASFLTAGFGILVAFVAWLVVTFTFISIALNLAVTLIITTASITVATFFLGFSALGATSQIARKALDLVLANCVKLLAIYLVVGVGASTITHVTDTIPKVVSSFDAYSWIIATSLLFWLVAKNLPDQLARVMTDSIQTNHGTSAAAMALTAASYAHTTAAAARLAHSATSGVISGANKIAGSAIGKSSASFNQMSPSYSGIGSSGGLPSLSTHYKHSGESSSNYSVGATSKSMPPASEGTTKTNDHGSASVSSSGRKAAAPSSTRSVPREKKSK